MKNTKYILRKIAKGILVITVTLILILLLTFLYFKFPLQAVPSHFKGIEIAHRGGWEIGIENAIPTMRESLSTGAKALEMDVQLTKDGHLIVMHDMTLDRTTNGTGKTIDYTLKEIKQLKIKDESGNIKDLRVPTLAEVLDSLPRDVVIELDVKGNNMDLFGNNEAKRMGFVIDSLSAKHSLQHIFASSFYPQYLYAIRQANPNIYIAHSFINRKTNKEEMLTSGFNAWLLSSRFILAFLGCGMVDAEYNNLSEKKINWFQQKNIVINAWTVNDLELKKKLLKQGISVTTNCPGGNCKDKADPFGR
ncbi:MAG: glycerophosphodiester phosphodiesterase family protein [Bacteroidetes bacterium]|nr:glycerophosphodiester phosphodiesterase family protein [Bacteroidota bacterium]